jgi:hypothetical protein
VGVVHPTNRKNKKIIGKHAGGGSVTTRRKCGEDGSIELLSVISVSRMNKPQPLYAVGKKKIKIGPILVTGRGVP